MTAGTATDAIRAALDEMDWLAAVHIAMQGDKSALIKDVREAETLRDRHESYVEREARSKWLRKLLAENERLAKVVEAARVYVASPYAGVSGYDAATQERFEVLRDALAALEEAGE